jgi:preprotein translocase subunit YajC
LLEILAQTPPTTGNTGGAGSTLMNLAPIIIVVIMGYFLLFNSKRKQDKKRQEMIDTLKKGDRIQTIGGVLGTVVSVDAGEVLVKVDESSNTKMRFTRAAIFRVINDDAKSESK